MRQVVCCLEWQKTEEENYWGNVPEQLKRNGTLYTNGGIWNIKSSPTVTGSKTNYMSAGTKSWVDIYGGGSFLLIASVN